MEFLPNLRPRSRRDAGFTLIEIVVVLVIFSVIVGMAAVITRGVAAAQKRSLTATRLATVDAALVQYVLQQKRLPCPADGRLESSNNNAGVETPPAGGGCTASQQYGVVPWRALALTEDEATDGWGRRLTYRVFPALGIASWGMDMSSCDPAGTEAVQPTPGKCTPGCTAAALTSCTPPSAFLAAKGLEVRTVGGTVVMSPAGVPPTGAAYVLISHGETGGGGYLNTGIISTTTVVDGTEEMKNYADRAPAPPNYVDDSISDVSGAAHFDDIVSRPSVLAVISKAGLGPRSH